MIADCRLAEDDGLATAEVWVERLTAASYQFGFRR